MIFINKTNRGGFILLACIFCLRVAAMGNLHLDNDAIAVPTFPKEIQSALAVTNTIDYVVSNEKFPNPERGFYKYSISTGSLSETTIRSYRNNNHTLIFHYFYLKDYRNKELDTAILNKFESTMNAIRKGGAKCILRLTYSNTQEEADAPLNIIERHLDQMKPYFEKHADVIAVWQAGLIGAWGEWYYSSNFGTPPTKSVCNTVLGKLLDVVPASRMVQVRYQGHKKDFSGRTTPLTAEEAFNGSDFARIGHHNDCFLASVNDHGTYEWNKPEPGKNYLNADCLFVPNGGETCEQNNDRNFGEGLNAYNEMRRLHFSYLNDDYNNAVNNLWIPSGYKDKIIKELGYRFELISGEFTAATSSNATFAAQIRLKNVGFAPLFNKRHVELVLAHRATGAEYYIRLNEDPRFWQPDKEITISVEAGIPQDMPQGDYDIYLHLPDVAESLYGNPDYSIRVANQNVWNATKGYNSLQSTVSVETGAGISYEGNMFFVPMGEPFPTETVNKEIVENPVRIWSENGLLMIKSPIECDVEIYTFAGKKVYSKKETKNEQILILQGIYIVKVNMNGKSYSQKIII